MNKFSQDYVELLIIKYKSGTLTAKEQTDFTAWYAELDDELQIDDVERDWQLKSRIKQGIDHQIHYPRRIFSLTPFKMIAAACALVVCALAYYFIFKPFSNSNTSAPQMASSDIAPGKSHAVLTLANGQKIILGEGGKKTITIGGATMGNNDGELVYSAIDDKTTNQMNMLTVPVGGQYKIILADGTRVWLNASSTLNYPTNFQGSERLVELSGEAYFEVTKDKARPFIVRHKKQDIKVLGTSFNVNGYAYEDKVYTTLVEGSVQLSANNASQLLKPGKQAVWNNEKFEVYDVDTDEVLAWKNGSFMFADEELESIMRKVARWYDIDVIYEKEALRHMPFVANITKYTNISEVLKVLQMTKLVHFEVKGRTVKVYAN